MRRDTAGFRLRTLRLRTLRLRTRRRAAAPAVLAAALAVGVTGLAGCGSQGGTGHSGAASAAPTGSDREASSGNATHNPLLKSPLRILTTLSQAQLCAALSTPEATRILGSRPAAPLYGRQSGLGIYCRWPKRGAAALSPDELYVGISSVVDWAGAQEVDKLLHAKSVRLDGRAALTAGPLPAMEWAQVDVALGGPGDPVAEYRAPTMAEALDLARTATPHIISMG
jgi:hypothetical protein